jgi:hypothetical protein
MMEHIDRILAPQTKSVSGSVICTQPVTPPETRWGNILLHPHNYRLPARKTAKAMIERSDLSHSNRTLSASSLKDRLSKLSVTPLRPVAALQARVE